MAFKYSGSSYTQKTFEIIPTGEQKLMIESIKEGESKSGKPMLTIVLRKDDNHSKIFHYITLNNEWTTRNIGDLLASVGRDPKQDGEIDWDSFKGDWLKAKVFHEEYNGQTGAKVKFFIADDSPVAPKAKASSDNATPTGDEIPF